MTMALLLLLSSCATTIRDFETCSPIPSESMQNLGAACDNFMTANQRILDPDEWITEQKLWLDNGDVVECTSSGSIANLKAEIEKLCSRTACNYDAKQAVNTALQGLDRMLEVGKKSLSLQNQ